MDTEGCGTQRQRRGHAGRRQLRQSLGRWPEVKGQERGGAGVTGARVAHLPFGKELRRQRLEGQEGAEARFGDRAGVCSGNFLFATMMWKYQTGTTTFDKVN